MKYQKKGTYKKISNEQRVDLFRMVRLFLKNQVYKKNIPVTKVAQMLKINYSTAKTILRIYRLEKRLLRKNRDKNIALQIEGKQNEENLFENQLKKMECQSLKNFEQVLEFQALFLEITRLCKEMLRNKLMLHYMYSLLVINYLYK
jgi:hypothetical protein